MTETKGKGVFKRRRLIVDELQYRLLLINLLYFLVGVTIVAAILFVPLMIQVRDVTLPVVQRGLIASELLQLHGRFWPAIMIAAGLLGLHSVLTSHRISGPLFRIRSVLGKMAGGDFSDTITFRRHDYLIDEADSVNQVLASLRSRFASLHGPQLRMHEALHRLEAIGATGDDRSHAAIDELKRAIVELGRQLEEIVLKKVPPSTDRELPETASATHPLPAADTREERG